jgi:long-chain acyl-CoA synthetase
MKQLESVYRSAAIVMNICIYASTTETKPIALIVPVEATLNELATSQGLKTHGMDDPANQKLVPVILSQLLAVGKKAGLANIELIQGVVLCPEEWTPQNVSVMCDVLRL